jgi:hypothetical protein
VSDAGGLGLSFKQTVFETKDQLKKLTNMVIALELLEPDNLNSVFSALLLWERYWHWYRLYQYWMLKYIQIQIF